MRTRFRISSNRWATGRLEVLSVRHSSRHKVMRIQITGNDSTRTPVVFEIKDQDIYRLADTLVDTAEAFEREKENHE